MNSDGSLREQLTNSSPALSPAWSPDGTLIAYAQGIPRRIQAIDVQSGVSAPITSIGTGFDDDFPEWLQTGPSTPPPPTDPYVRPRGATPFSTFFVPASEACESPNSAHGEPLAFGSCTPPVPISDRLTVGLKARAWVRMRVLRGNPSTSWDDADVEVIMDASDVRRSATLADYDGELVFSMIVRVTDRSSGPGPNAATVDDVPVEAPVRCEVNSDTSIGGSCRLDTTIDAMLGGNAVIEGARGIWQLGQIQLFDGGSDDTATTPPNQLFEVQGLFVP
jgi:hypothetical protein